MRPRSSPLPPGAASIGAGLAAAGISTYAFLAIAGHAVPAVRYSSFAAFWALLFVIGPGMFLPLEQELARALAARRENGDGGAAVIVRCAVLGAAFLSVLLAGAGIASGAIDHRLLGDDPLLMVALLLGLAAYCLQHLVRGTLSGNGRFRAYGILLGSEGLYRVGLCAALAAAHVRTPGAYGLAVVGGSYLAVGTALLGQRGLVRHGSSSRSAELGSALAALLLTSLATQFMINGGTVVVALLARPGEQRAAGTFLNGRILAFVPLYLFQAVNAALLPKLSALSSSGAMPEFAHQMRRLLTLVAGLGGLAVAGAFALGPPALHLVFGPAFDLGRADLAILAAVCTALMAAQALGQALIAQRRYRWALGGWLVAVVAFVATVAGLSPLILRVELGLLAGAGAGAATMAAVQASLWRGRCSAAASPPAQPSAAASSSSP